MGDLFRRFPAKWVKTRQPGNARYIERATMPAERIVPLAAVADGDAPYFSTILVHRRGAAWT